MDTCRTDTRPSCLGRLPSREATKRHTSNHFGHAIGHLCLHVMLHYQEPPAAQGYERPYSPAPTAEAEYSWWEISPHLTLPRFCISCSNVTVSRAPVQPSGCPSAMAPPLTFTMDESMLSTFWQYLACGTEVGAMWFGTQ
mgnify:CR=1 FL=1